GRKRPPRKPGRPHAAGSAALGGGLRPAERGRAPTPNRDRVRGTATPATPRVRHRSTSFRTPRGRVGTLVPHNIRWRTLHTLRWRTLHTYDGERSTHTMANASTHTMANAPHITMANAPHITMANAPHITMASAHHIQSRTPHT